MCVKSGSRLVGKITDNFPEMLKWLEKNYIEPYAQANKEDLREAYIMTENEYYDFERVKEFISEAWNLDLEKTEYLSSRNSVTNGV